MKYICRDRRGEPLLHRVRLSPGDRQRVRSDSSLGDGLRPGCIEDASDRAKYMEFIMLGELVKRARDAGVQAMVEGPGHVPANEIETSVKAMKHLTDGAPLYLLGPLCH